MNAKFFFRTVRDGPRGLTLAELTVTIGVVVMVIGAIVSLFASGQKLVGAIGQKADLQARTILAVETMLRNIRYANRVDWSASERTRLRISVDRDDPPTPGTGDDTVIEYRQEGTDLREYPDAHSKPGKYRVLTRDVDTLDFSVNGAAVTVALKLKKGERKADASTRITLRNARIDGELPAVLYVYE